MQMWFRIEEFTIFVGYIPCKVRESDANQINIYCYGLQQRFIDWSMEVANASGAKYIHATVNPDNNHSGQNFLKRGFAVKKTGTKYDGLTRNLLEFKVKS